METVERKNKRDVLTLEDLPDETRARIYAHRATKKRVITVNASAMVAGAIIELEKDGSICLPWLV